MRKKEQKEQINNDLQFGRRLVPIPDSDEEIYIRIPTAQEQYEAKLEKTREFNRLLKNPDYLTKKEIIELYKSRGQDIKVVHDEIDKLRKDLNIEFLSLAKIMNDKKKKEKIAELSEKIKNLRLEIQELISKETIMFENSIESLSELCEHYALIAACAEKKIKDEYIKVYSSTQEFVNDKDTKKGLALTSAFLQMYYGYGVNESPFVNWLAVENGK